MMDGKSGNAVRMFPLLSPLLPGRPMPGSPMPSSPSFPQGPAAVSQGEKSWLTAVSIPESHRLNYI